MSGNSNPFEIASGGAGASNTAPVRVGIIGEGTLINDGTLNWPYDLARPQTGLTFRLTNLSSRPLEVLGYGKHGPVAATHFYLYFQSEDATGYTPASPIPWALSTENAIADINVSFVGLNGVQIYGRNCPPALPEGATNTMKMEISLEQELTLGYLDFIDIVLQNIATDYPDGNTAVLFSYDNLYMTGDSDPLAPGNTTLQLTKGPVAVRSGNFNISGQLTVNGAEVYPTGMIVLWSGIGNAPTGWAFCDGQEGRPSLPGLSTDIRYIIKT